jgi:hypothetical protein
MDHVAARCHQVLEPLHAMIHFVPELQDKMVEIGFRPGRMGAMASRVAPLGAVTLGAVASVFYTFNPELIGRFIPRAWTLASPERIVATRLAVADLSYRRLLGDEVIGSAALRETAELARQAAEACVPGGRMMFAAHAAAGWPDEPHVALWHAATLLREYRGDGHLAVLVSRGIDPMTALITHTATGGGFSPAWAKVLRGWSDEQWDQAVTRAKHDGLLDETGALTERGTALRTELEDATNELASAPWRALGEDKAGRLHELAQTLTRRIVAEGAFPDGVFADPVFNREERG